MNSYNHRDIRKKLGVSDDVLLSPKKPQPVIVDNTLFQVLTHIGVFSIDDCQKIINDNSSEGFGVAEVVVGRNDDTPKENLQIRDSSNIWIERNDTNMWLFDKMLALVMSANKQFGFEVDFFEALQLAKYEVGQFYNWHVDLGPGHMGNRKLSVTVQLSDTDSYEGGDLVLDDGADFMAPRELGSVTVFPSFMRHKVTPVTKGTRYSLVVWASGTQRFR